MFKRLKNWIIDRPASDHGVASFAWFGASYLALGSAVAFPALAPVTVGAAVLASKVGVLEGIITGAHVVNNILSWGFKKLFGSKNTPARTEAAPSHAQPEKSNEATHQNLKEKPLETTKDNPQTIQAPQPQKQPENKPQLVQVPAEQLAILMKQIQVLTTRVEQMQQEVLALRLENQKLKLKLKPENNRTKRPVRQPLPQRRLVTHRHYIQNGRLMHD